MKLGRRFIGADINLGAIQITTKRLMTQGKQLALKPDNLAPLLFTGFEVYNVNHYDVFRNPVQAKELLIEALEIQKLEFSTVFDGEKDGRMVKIMPTNRIATRADLNELIAGFDYKAWDRRKAEAPTRPVEKVTLVCPPASALSVTRSSCEASTLTAPPADAARIGRPVCTTSRCPEESVNASGSAAAFRTHGE